MGLARSYDIHDPLTDERLRDSTQGYSPCPSEVLQDLATLVEPVRFGGSLLDNCAGTGHTAGFLAKAWGLRPVLVEPDPARHRRCVEFDRYAVCAAAQSVRGRGKPTVWLFNPPFDKNDPDGSIEKHIIAGSLHYAAGPGTLCVWLLHRRILSDPYFVALTQSSLARLIIRAFPEPLFSEYEQIVLFGFWNPCDDHSIPFNLGRDDRVSELQKSEFALKLVQNMGIDFEVFSTNHDYTGRGRDGHC